MAAGCGRLVRSSDAVESFAPREIVAEPLDPFLLAIHVIDVVAEKQVQVLVALSRELQLDGIELEQQVVAECAHQREPRVVLTAEFVDQNSKNGKCRRLLAALLFGKQRGQRFQSPVQAGTLDLEFIPVGMFAKQRAKDLIDNFAPLIERAEIDVAASGHNLERRRYGRHIPARVTFRIFVARGKVDTAIPVQLVQQAFQPFVKRNSRL